MTSAGAHLNGICLNCHDSIDIWLMSAGGDIPFRNTISPLTLSHSLTHTHTHQFNVEIDKKTHCLVIFGVDSFWRWSLVRFLMRLILPQNFHPHFAWCVKFNNQSFIRHAFTQCWHSSYCLYWLSGLVSFTDESWRTAWANFPQLSFK